MSPLLEALVSPKTNEQEVLVARLLGRTFLLTTKANLTANLSLFVLALPEIGHRYLPLRFHWSDYLACLVRHCAVDDSHATLSQGNEAFPIVSVRSVSQ